jgi:aryl-alcohol dehydrogenase-like predicted oxidoreductase
MKPVAWGALPAKLALKWILNKPIDTAVPGATTLEQLKEDCLVGNLKNFSLTKKERNEENELKNKVKPESFWWHSARQ